MSDLTTPLYDILGQGHVLKSVLGFIRRWREDANFKINPEIERAEKAVSEYHRRVVAAAKYVESKEEMWKVEIEARDFAISKLAENLDLEYDVQGQFFALVENFRATHQANKLADALTK